jgi:hypothetical protein
VIGSACAFSRPHYDFLPAKEKNSLVKCNLLFSCNPISTKINPHCMSYHILVAEHVMTTTDFIIPRDNQILVHMRACSDFQPIVQALTETDHSSI